MTICSLHFLGFPVVDEGGQYAPEFAEYAPYRIYGPLSPEHLESAIVRYELYGGELYGYRKKKLLIVVDPGETGNLIQQLRRECSVCEGKGVLEDEEYGSYICTACRMTHKEA